jgi:single-strand DNA-binding protein
MANEPLVLLVGNATANSELRYVPSGSAVCSWTLAVTPRVKQGDTWTDGEPVYYRCSAWKQLGESAAESVVRGMRLVVWGRLKVRTYEKDGVTRTSLDVEVEHVGAEMRYAVVTAKKAERTSTPAPAEPDPWGSSPGKASNDDEPF